MIKHKGKCISLKPKSNQDKEPTSGDISSVKRIKFIPTDKIYTGSYMEAYEDGFEMLKEQLPDLIQEVDSKAYLKGLKDGGILLELHIRKALAKQKREIIKKVKNVLPKWIDNPYGEVSSYTYGRRDEREDNRKLVIKLLSERKGEK